MLKLRKCSNGKWVFDKGDYVEVVNSKRKLKVHACSKGRYVADGPRKLRLYLEYLEEKYVKSTI